MRNNLDFLVLRQVVHEDVEHEPVELRFRQWIGAFHLDRVLSGEHKERFVERIPFAGGRDLMFLHCFQQRRLRLGRRAVDFVGEDDVGEDRPLDEDHLPLAFLVLLEDFRTGDVGRHQVGRELNPLKLQMEQVRHAVDQERLGQAGGSRDETMPAGEQREQQLLDHVLLADDDLFQFIPDLLPRPAQQFEHSTFLIR